MSQQTELSLRTKPQRSPTIDTGAATHQLRLQSQLYSSGEPTKRLKRQ